MLKIDDIKLEIFVLTYNRAKYLDATLKSIVNQSYKKFNIIVLDNNSTDETELIVKKYQNLHDIKYIRNDLNIGVVGNFLKAKELASKEFAMIFHDDDIMHPEYVETALKLLEQNNDSVFLGAAMSFELEPDFEFQKNNAKAKILSQKDFASLLYRGFPYHYASTVFRTKFLKKAKVEFKKYGKLSDRPVLINLLQYGKAIVLLEPYIKYRLHPEQDSQTKSSGPFLSEIIELNKLYKSILGDSVFNKYGRSFLLANYIYINQSFKELYQTKKLKTKIDYLNTFIKNEASSLKAILIGYFIEALPYRVYKIIKNVKKRKQKVNFIIL
ncbi:glycosyltransferase family 2 protein [Carboxydothermus pertinax]|uniref:Glycosyltransferase 2-like domain-containing protein n=1 Tax=Carboxydothermus pertinax TaxID=870242 RepID=A0A1L8CUU0_9THEO|nr:glycosyltransferase family 2 protein [Carboxydothermus pertinax]GAV22609.1 hypothetical protein cpu_11190 [Carboxydothermus pertinax]